MNCKRCFICFIGILIFSVVTFAQTKESKDVENKRREILRILSKDFPNTKLRLFKNMTEDELWLHKEKLFEQYKDKGVWVESGAPPYYYYNRHFHPSKVEALRNIGVELPPPLSPDHAPYREYVIFAETIVIGRIRKFVYHPEKSKIFHTSAIVLVDEFLRDDFGLKDDYNEIRIKLRSGPIEGGSWTRSSLDPELTIGEKCIFYLTRDGYIGDLVWYQKNIEPNELTPNIFVLSPSQKFPIVDSKVNFNQYILDLEKVKEGIEEVVKILDVEQFYEL